MWLYLTHTTFRFYLLDFQLNTDFPSQFRVFHGKSPSAPKKIGFSRKCFWKEQKPVAFFRNTIGSKFFYSNSKQFQVFKIAKFEFKVTIHYRLYG